MKKIIYLGYFVVFVSFVVFAQEFISVDLDNPVYRIISIAENRGLIEPVPISKPYSNNRVKKILENINQYRAKLDEREIDILDYYLNYFGNKQNRKSNLTIFNNSEKLLKDFTAGFELSGNYRINSNNIHSPNIYNGVSAYFTGDLFNNLSYYASLGFSVDKLSPDIFYNNIALWIDRRTYENNVYPFYITNSKVNFYSGYYDDFIYPGTYAPYQYTQEWDGHHTRFKSGLNDGVTREFTIGLQTQDEISAEFYDSRLSLRIGKIRREWGFGEGSLVLSDTAYPFEGGELHISPVKWFDYSYLVGSLGNWFVDTYIDRNRTIPKDSFLKEYSEQKMLVIQQGVIYPNSWSKIQFSSSAIIGKRFEMSYLSPFLMPFIVQEFNGDMDNVGLNLGASFDVPYIGEVYGSLFLDETSLSKVEEIFTYARNLYSYQGGIRSPINIGSFSSLTLQYTKINPFVYSHYYEENYPGYSVPVSMTYTNQGSNLGYFLPPNSDELLFQFDTFPAKRLMTTFKYQLIRHGTNNPTDADNDGIPDGQIYGDINIPMDYSEVENYPLKNFLYDGVYDWSNIVSLKARYMFPGEHLSVGLEYFFNYTFWVLNGRNVNIPDGVTQNVIALTFKYK